MKTALGIRRSGAFVVASLILLAACSGGNKRSAGAQGDDSVPAALFRIVESSGSFLIVDDLNDSFANTSWLDWTSTSAFHGALEDTLRPVLAAETRFIAVLTHFDGPRRFYRPLANDVHGIGFEHWPEGVAGLETYYPPEAPFFDGTPLSAVQGLFSFGPWKLYWDAGTLNETFLAYIVCQELAHAWVAYPRFQAETNASDEMLGIEDSHWSLYLATGHSPLDGLAWSDAGDGAFTASAKSITSAYEYVFSDLDLYLMGLLPASDADPWFLIRNPTNCVIDGEEADCPGASSRPFPFGEIGLPGAEISAQGERVDVSIADVIAAEGERVPPYGDGASDAPRDHATTFVLLKHPDQSVSAEDVQLIDTVITRATELWFAATGQRSQLVNASP